MMKFSLRLIVLFCVTIVFLLSCSAPKAIEYRDFQHFRIENIGFSSSQVKMDLVYFNPNNFGLQLKRTEVDVYVNNVLLGSTSQDYQIAIPKKAEFSIPLSMDVVMKNLLKNGWNVYMNKEVTVKVTGKVKVGKANVFISFPISYEGKQSISF